MRERIGRLKEEPMAFNFLTGARPATALQLLFIRWPVIPLGPGFVSSYRLGFKHRESLPERRRVLIQHASTSNTGMTQLHISITVGMIDA